MGIVVFALVWLVIEGIGVPLLSEGAFGPLGAAVHDGEISLFFAYLGAWAATCLGNTVGFFLFYHYGQNLAAWLERRWPAFAEQRARLEPRVRTQLYFATTLTRFVGLGTFQVTLWLSGLVRANWKIFLPLLYLLNAIWTAVWLLGSHWLVGELLPLLEGRTLPEIILIIGLVALVLFAGHRLWAWATSRRGRRGV